MPSLSVTRIQSLTQELCDRVDTLHHFGQMRQKIVKFTDEPFYRTTIRNELHKA